MPIAAEAKGGGGNGRADRVGGRRICLAGRSLFVSSTCEEKKKGGGKELSHDAGNYIAKQLTGGLR